MQAVGNHIIVHIDKAKQKKLQDSMEGIQLPPNYVFMKFNLQHGTILSIGPDAAKAFPELSIGDIAIFHHSVEHNENHFIKSLDNGDELRGVRVFAADDEDSQDNQVYGVIKSSGKLISHPDWIFVSQPKRSIAAKYVPEIEMVNRELFTSNGYLIAQMEMLGQQIDQLQQTSKGTFDIYKRKQIDDKCREYNKERESVSRFINKEKIVETTVLFCPPNSLEKFGFDEGSLVSVTHADGLIPLSLQGILYFLAMTQFVVGVSE